MESAGEICQFCQQPLLSEADVAACNHCCALFHQACLQNAQYVCAACGKPCDTIAQCAAESASQPAIELPEGEFQRLKPAPLYRFSLVVVSLAMVLLPVLYLGIIALFVWGVLAYAVRFAGMMSFAAHGMGGLMLVFLLYFGPLLVGGIMSFFLVKPLFAPRRQEEKPFSLNHADAPQLFALVGWICRSLEAPIPSRIDVNCKVNARAGFRNRWRSILDNDLVLEIGLPLAAGMNLAQFAGIIAHEYGHFSQGTAMRASCLIGEINGWFYRVVHERDQWDLALELESERPNQPMVMRMVFYLARFGVWLTRRLLWVLMVAGHALSCFMSRQMEFDADRYEVRLAGSEAFSTTTRRLRQLNLGSDAAIRQIREKWQKERKLFDQIPDFIVSCADEISAEAQDKLHAALLRRKTRLFDMHPSDAERMEHALAAQEPGILHSTLPATSLFANFPELSRRITMSYYQSVFGREIPADRLISTQQLKTQAEHDYAADRAQIQGFFLGMASELRPVFITENMPFSVHNPEKLVTELQSCRRQMETALPQVKPAFAEFLYWETRLLQSGQAAQLLQAGFQFDPTEFGLADNDIESAQTEALAALQTAGSALLPFENAGKTRITIAMQLLRQMSMQIPNGLKLQEEAKELIFIQARLGDIFEPLLELRKLSTTLEIVLAYRNAQPAADNATAVLENLCTEIQERVNLIQQKTASVRYPFHVATEQVMISQHVRNKNYDSNPHELALREGKSHTEKLLDMYVRVLARLTAIAEEVEKQVTA